ncbi:AAA family ATPase [Schaalia suimastitidis]|uniref:AAA family ATPase n=1 Tax=Schaalia suimastitidis TaxID=121163 RepID=UPI00040D4237|nr:SMC family ATPase [Schaalia suimastitidis]
MKLHRLTLCGIGPFHGEYAIDFTAFDDSGLFLLEGPTGAGKSTIIDAVTFALYGDVARQADSDKARLRSAYCTAHDKSWVDLIFEVNAGVFRVHRTPSYVKEGRKTPVAATVRLERLSAADCTTAGELVSRSVGEADAEIHSIVGLSKEQFLQTVVLPQGKFSQFLTSTSKEREEILRDVFGASLFSRIENLFKERAREGETALDAAHRDARLAWELLVHAVRDDLATQAQMEVDTDLSALDRETSDRLVTQTAAYLQLLEGKLARARANLNPLVHNLAQADKHLTQARNTARILAEQADLHNTLSALEGRNDHIAAMQHTLRLSQEYSAVLPVVSAERQAQADYHDALTQLNVHLDECTNAAHALGIAFTPPRDTDDAAISPLPFAQTAGDTDSTNTLVRVGSDTGDTGRLRQSLTALSASARATQVTLSRGKDLSRQRQQARARAVSVNNDLAAQQALEASLDDAIAAFPEQLANAQEEYQAKQQLAAGLETQEAAYAQVLARLEAAQKAEQLTQTIALLHSDARDAVDEATTRSREASRLHTQWLTHTAVALSAELTAGEPCPVCGSTSHPQPAHLHANGDEAVTRSQVEDADTAKKAADDVVATLYAKLAEQQAALKAAQARADGTVDELTDALSQAEATVEQSRQARACLEDIRTARDTLEAAFQQARNQREQVRQQSSALAAQYEAAQREADQAQAALEADGLDSVDLEARLVVVERLIEGASSALTQVSLCEERQHVWLTHHDTCKNALATASIPCDSDPESFLRLHILPAAESERIAQEIDDHAVSMRATQERLAVLQTGLAPHTVPPDIDAAEAVYQQCQQALEQARIELSRSDDHLDAVRAQVEAVKRAFAAYHATHQQCAPLRRLAALATASGRENLKLTPLSTWVLLTRFEEVLACANPRLLAISNGRYELRRTDDDGTRSRRGGLGLEIVDHDTDESRPTRTLSGGETFYTSLALALALADVVTAEAGGITLHTMFVDEGFGSLDSETLDVVMGQLEALRDQGRTVGVISHVEEMSRRIPDKITVTWTKTQGSRLHIRS